MIRKTLICSTLVLAATLLAGCPTSNTSQVNPYLTYAEDYGIVDSVAGSLTGSGARGQAANVGFRQTLNLTFVNNHRTATLNTWFIAWVDIGNIRTADQQDALFAGNYIQLAQPVEIGSAFVLPVGTFVYNGAGTAGATAVRLGPTAGAEGGTLPSSDSVQLITPDAILVLAEPPVSCESKAFIYTQQDEPVPSVPSGPVGPWEGATLSGAYKTLAQVDAYQCEPFRPGLFLNLGDTVRRSNEFVEGENIAVNFYDDGQVSALGGDAFARVTTGTEEVPVPDVSEEDETGTGEQGQGEEQAP